MKKKYLLLVRGKQSEWGFTVEVEPGAVEEARADGVNIAGEVFNTVPDWLPAGLTRPWCFFQDLFNFRNPLAKD